MVTIRDLVEMMFEKLASDLYLTMDAPPVLRIDGEIVITEFEKLTSQTCEVLIFSVLTDTQKEFLKREKELLISFGIKNIGRIRMNVYMQQGTVAASLRSIPDRIPGFEELGLPPLLKDIVQLPKGLVLITGPTASGKSMTLTAIVDCINRSRKAQIMVLEDPCEYLHTNQQSIVNQREIGTDTQSYARALQYILRGHPDVIVISELENLATMRAALTIAETGHLVFGSLNTNDSIQAICRMIDLFPPHQQFGIRRRISVSLQAILTQQLLPRGYSSGRILACEVLVPTSAVRSLIREEKEKQIYSLMQTGSEYGMQTMNQALFELYQKQLVTYNEIFSRTTDPRDLQGLVKGTT